MTPSVFISQGDKVLDELSKRSTKELRPHRAELLSLQLKLRSIVKRFEAEDAAARRDGVRAYVEELAAEGGQ